MLELSDTPQERIFAYGWASHIVSDVIGHPKFTNITHAEFAGGARAELEGIEAYEGPLEHKKTEFGASAYLLGLEHNSYLWDVRFEFPISEGSQDRSIVEEAFLRTYGCRIDRKSLVTSMKSLRKSIIRIPIVMKLLGSIKGRWYDILENPVSLILRYTALPLYLLFIDKEANQGTVAVLKPFKLKANQKERLIKVIDEIVGSFRSHLGQDFKNMRNLNLDSGKSPGRGVSPYADELISSFTEDELAKIWDEEIGKGSNAMLDDWRTFCGDFYSANNNK